MPLGRPSPAPTRRLEILWSCLWVGTGLLVVRLLDLQVIRNVYYLKAAERNRTQMIFQTGPRGRIFDRHGRVLATNRPAFSALFLPGKKSDPAALLATARSLAPQLGLDPGELYDQLRRSVKDQVPVRLAENLPARTMFRLSELTPFYPGVDVIVEARRTYPYGAFASHLLGYIGQIEARQWTQLRLRGYRADSRVGKAGVEGMLESELRGVDGGIQLEVDAQGRLKRVVQKVPWGPGADVFLSLDAEIQRAAEDALRDSPSGEGAVVVLDPQSGDLLALASIPDFDPNLFLVPKDEETRLSLQALPEFNLAIQGTFAPGSTFKPITAAAAFNEGRLEPEEKFNCPGYYDLRTRTFLCWKPEGHGRRSWHGGIADSCDVYFYNAGLKAGGALIERYERLFRLGQPTHVPLKGEKRGNLFGPKARGGKGWYDGDTLNLSIGQGELLVTPIQMASLYMALANKGTFYRPAFLQRITQRSGRVLFERKPEVLERVPLKQPTWDLLWEGLRAVVEEGTGRRVRLDGVEVWGKTGTAENPLGEDHAWFCAFAAEPGRPPRIALAVLVQHGGHGAEAAGPVARRILEAAFPERLKSRVPRPELLKPAAAPGLQL